MATDNTEIERLSLRDTGVSLSSEDLLRIWRDVPGFVTDITRAIPEFKRATAARREGMLRVASTSDSKIAAVMVPGICSSTNADFSFMRQVLDDNGVIPIYTNIKFNILPPEVADKRIGDAVRQAYEITNRGVVLIGHSYGGMLARHYAKLYPDNISHVITLASPLNVTDERRIEVNGVVKIPLNSIIRVVGPEYATDFLNEMVYRPLQMPNTSIYSKDDRIVSYRICIPRKGEGDAIAVESTHIGMSRNAAALIEVMRILRSEQGT
jgi:predicted alpha/beta hydrolase family esterase